jgi:hypothetical protein
MELYIFSPSIPSWHEQGQLYPFNKVQIKIQYCPQKKYRAFEKNSKLLHLSYILTNILNSRSDQIPFKRSPNIPSLISEAKIVLSQSRVCDSRYLEKNRTNKQCAQNTINNNVLVATSFVTFLLIIMGKI